MNIVASLIFFMFGLTAILLFHAQIIFPISISIAIYVGVSMYLLQQFRGKRVGILILLLWIVFILPFIHIIPYMWFDFNRESPTMLWGLVVNPYMLDEQIIMLTAMLGATAGLGFAFGVSISCSKIDRISESDIFRNEKVHKTLPTPIWFVWVSLAIIFSWIAAPSETIFTKSYAPAIPLLLNIQIDSAWLISAILLIYSFCDTVVEQNSTRRSIKFTATFFVVGYITIFLEILRGDREMVPMIFSILLLYYYWAAPLSKRLRDELPLGKLSFGAFILVAVSMVLGNVRSSLSDVKSISDVINLLEYMTKTGQLSMSNLLHGTWSAVLLTPLSVSGDYISGLLPLKYGQDYFNLLLSIVPGFIANIIGYIRPIDALHGPAWEMRYGLGGTHAVVLPFMNFRMIGVFVIPTLWAYMFTLSEKTALKKLNVSSLSLLGTIATVAPHLLWYGEKLAITALIIWIFLRFIYKLSLSIGR